MAIERPDGPVVDMLLAAGLSVVVISPNQLKNLRGRYGSAGNKDDRFDAYVLADTLRTDRPRLRPLTPDGPATVALRRDCRARKDLVGHRIAAANQLRARLQTVFPAAVGLFAELDSPISLKFLTRFDCRDKADWLSPKRFAACLASVGSCGRVDAPVLHARLRAAPRGVTGADGAAHAHVTRALLTTLSTLVEQIQVLSEQIAEQLAPHADAHIFTSLPRSGTVRAARLLAEIGGCRVRFPTPESLACLAGVAPSTRQSGKHRAVGFRWAADKQLRDAVCDFAAWRTAPAGAAPPCSRVATAFPPATPATPTPGPPTSTDAPPTAGTTIRTPSASSPAPGSTSSGTAGKTASPTTRPNTGPSKPSTEILHAWLDTGLLTPAGKTG